MSPSLFLEFYFLLNVVLLLGVFVGYLLYVMLMVLCFLAAVMADTFVALLRVLLTNLMGALVGVFRERLVSRVAYEFRSQLEHWHSLPGTFVVIS